MDNLHHIAGVEERINHKRTVHLVHNLIYRHLLTLRHERRGKDHVGAVLAALYEVRSNGLGKSAGVIE